MSSSRLFVTTATAAARVGTSLLHRSHALPPSRFHASASHSNQVPPLSIFPRPQQLLSFSSTTATLTPTLSTVPSWLPASHRNVPSGFGCAGRGTIYTTSVSCMPVLPMVQSPLQQQIRLKHSIKTNKSVSKRIRTRGSGSLKR
jgi:hypothetical protein